MKVSELIKELLALLKENGDCNVYAKFSCGCCEVVGEPEPRVSNYLDYTGVHLN